MTGTPRPTAGQRAAAIIALVLLGLLGLYALLVLFTNVVALALGAVGLATTVAGAWWVVTERMPRRAIGAAAIVVGLGVIAIAVIAASDGGRDLRQVLLILGMITALGGLSALFARLALMATLHEQADSWTPFTPRHPVLIYNEKSGGGKVVTFGLLDIARELGVETVALTPGSDLSELARSAVDRGADCLAMAGGDGSQALVAAVAVERGVPFVCIPAGTRNHFALDLGLDRDDPRGAMQALASGELRTVDYATVGGRLFVNNVSFGVYATIVQSDDYRDAKISTSSQLLPDLIGPAAEPFDLQFALPDGTNVDDVFVILVSNNPYVVGLSLQTAKRPSIEGGQLGIVAARARTGADAVTVLAEATLHVSRADGLIQFAAPEFEVRSRSGRAYAGVDGEAVELTTPAHFAIHPRGLTVLMPPAGVGRAKHSLHRRVDVRALTAIAAGRLPAPS